MCGRFASVLPADELARIFATEGPLPDTQPSWNIAPTQPAVVVRRHPQTAARQLSVLNWGLLASFVKDPASARRPFNARAETVATSTLFRGAFARRRCLVPADAYYEWRTEPAGKQPFAVARADGTPLALGGIWEGHRGADGEITRSFAIVTVPANELLRTLHERAPLVVEAADWATWLGGAPDDALHLLHPAGDACLRFWPVGKAVNNTRNNGPELLAPDVPGDSGLLALG